MASITTVLIPDVWKNSTTIAPKLQDFLYFTATAVFRIQVNAQKFSAGRLLAWYEPIPDNVGTFGAVNTLTCWTSYPNVEIDAGTGETVEFEAPFVMHVDAYDLKNSGASWGRLNLNVFVPLTQGDGSTTASVEIYVWMKDVNLSIPTPNNTFVPAHQIAKAAYLEELRNTNDQLKADLKYVEVRDHELERVFRPINAYAQMKNEGESVARNGTFSAPLSEIAKISGAVGKMGLGEVSGVASGISWVAELGSKAASLMGYCKPTDEGNLQKVIEYPAFGYTNMNGSIPASTLAADHRNCIEGDPALFSDTRDEMDISYICSRMVYVTNFNWPTTSAAGAQLKWLPVSPGLCGSTSNDTYASPGPMAYTASMFRYWRGGLNYRFSFVKNAFFSGRIAVVFIPGVTSVADPLTLGQLDAMPKVILDLRTSSEFVVRVPYVSNTPTEVITMFVDSTTSVFWPKTALPGATGVIAVYVMTALKTTGNTATSITCNIHIGGAEDIEFAVPSFPQIMPWIANTVPAPPPDNVYRSERINTLFCNQIRKNQIKSEPSRANAYTQMMDASDTKEVTPGSQPVHKVILDVKSSPLDEAGRRAIGERLVSVRPLTRRGVITSNSATPASDVYIDPNWMGDNTNFTAGNFTTYGYICQMYRFFRGGIIVRFLPTNSALATGVNPTVLSITVMDNDAPPSPPVFGSGTATTEAGFSDLLAVNNKPFIETKLPYMRQYTRNYRGSVGYGAQRYYLKIINNSVGGGNIAGTLLMSAADDWTAGFLVGPPLIRRT